MKILLAVDGSTCSDAAVEAVAKRPWPEKSELKVINVAEPPILMGMEPWIASPQYFGTLERSIRETALRVLETAVAKLKTSKFNSLQVSSQMIQGSPAQMIVEEAERWGADLIVMGSRGLGAWSRLLLGSVSNSVVHHAKCSVEIIRGCNGQPPPVAGPN